MITLIVGHRGSGKTSFLPFLNVGNNICIDLDKKISEQEGRSISAIFSLQGENTFRKIEKALLYKVIKNFSNSDKNIFISVGAGFFSTVPAGVKVLWLQRKTDAQARIFFNRPSLDKTLSPSQEYKAQFKKREQYYKSIAHQVICLPEYIFLKELQTHQKSFLSEQGPTFKCDQFFIQLKKLIECYLPSSARSLTKNTIPTLQKAGITLEEHMIKDKFFCQAFLKQRLDWGILFFEVRDDLISEESFKWIKTVVPLNKLLLSCRESSTYFSIPDLQSAWAWDWPLEKTLKACLFNIPFSIISFHGEASSHLNFDCVYEYLDTQIYLANEYNKKKSCNQKVHCKFSPQVDSFSSLSTLYNWFAKGETHRSILPRSKEGRWSWFRAYLYGKIKINFIKESRSSIFCDQILLADQFFIETNIIYFAAILGKPIDQSLTPFVHYDFFRKKNIPLLSITLSADEVKKEMLYFLQTLGLQYAAITSPLKKAFYNLQYPKVNHSDRLKKRKSANTLVFNKQLPNLFLDNTDQEGLVFLINTLFKEIKEKNLFKVKNKKDWKLALWGGGGVSSMLAEVYPDIPIFSARQSRCISHNIDEKLYSPEIVLWAVPSIYLSPPPKQWSPKVILDLNYSEDSLGREYALLKNIFYKNGTLMFLAQAVEQQKIWKIKN